MHGFLFPGALHGFQTEFEREDGFERKHFESTTFWSPGLGRYKDKSKFTGWSWASTVEHGGAGAPGNATNSSNNATVSLVSKLKLRTLGFELGSTNLFVPRVTGGGNKDGFAHRWRAHCGAGIGVMMPILCGTKISCFLENQQI